MILYNIYIYPVVIFHDLRTGLNHHAFFRAVHVYHDQIDGLRTRLSSMFFDQKIHEYYHE